MRCPKACALQAFALQVFVFAFFFFFFAMTLSIWPLTVKEQWRQRHECGMNALWRIMATATASAG
jgi:hypothetical protein